MSVVNSLKWLSGNERFLKINYRLAMGRALGDEDAAFCLSVAILLIREYEEDERKTSYLEFGYCLILNYALENDNYVPLFDLSTNLGFYPVSKFILENNMVGKEKLDHFFVDSGLSKYNYQNITETLEQSKFRNQLIESKSIDNCYVAPTSFGKSSLMVDLISSLGLSKIFIIVPTKSLLTQTYKLISSKFLDRKVIFHDEMYSGESRFIAVFTQERALRLLRSEDDLKVDALLVDEAHNLFESSYRSILLGRLIRRVRVRKPSSRVFYFSPLINDGDNLKFEEHQEIDTKCIQFNIKEADISEYRLDGKVYKYNRFLDEFFDVGFEQDMLTYIISNMRSNNFLYLRAPRKVENFAKILSERLPFAGNSELERLAKTISKNVHEDFYCVELVKKGVLYIHGKLPDLIKEYLEFNFKSNSALKLIVANSVILEGVNLPIDNLYILNTHSLGAKGLTNLIGRVNRLNEVFGGESPSLTKLKPLVHFVNSEEFNRRGSNMSNKIKLLKPRKFSDEIKNPTLLNFDILKYDREIEKSSNPAETEKSEKKKDAILSIIERENFLVTQPKTDVERMKLQFLESGLHSTYYDHESAFSSILKKIKDVQGERSFEALDPIEKVYLVCIYGIESEIEDLPFVRLKNEKARNYYRSFVKNIHSLTLKEHINSTVAYFNSRASNAENSVLYIGGSYGDLDSYGGDSGAKVYIDLSVKTQKELVNLALVKIKMESDFLSYKLNEFVSLLKDYGVVSEKDYDIFIYGTANKRNSDLSKLGLSGAIIKKFESDGQIDNIEVDELGHVSVNEDFKDYLEMQDDLVRFEINKYITV